MFTRELSSILSFLLFLTVPALETAAREDVIGFSELPSEGVKVLKGYSGKPSGKHGICETFELDLPPFRRGCYFVTPDKPQWPDGTNKLSGESFGSSLKKVNTGGMFLLLELNSGEYLAILPIAGRRTLTWFGGQKGKLLLHLGTLGKAEVSCDAPIVSWSRASDPYIACRKAWGEALENPSLDGGAKIRSDKHYPELFEYLGWCSWEEFRGDIDKPLLTQAVRDIEGSGLPVRYTLIDNGHLDKDEKRRMMSFNPNEKFSGGWSDLLAMRKADKITWMGIWFSFNGCKNGISPQNRFGAKINDHLAPVDNKSTLMPKGDLESSKVFYDAFVGSIEGHGFDFIKFDHQGKNTTFYTGGENAVNASYNNVTAMEEAVHRSGKPLINCMALNPVCAFNTRYSAVTRCSRDYNVGNAVKGKDHLYQSYINSLWMGQTVWPDHDMFHSSDPACGQMMAISKAMSGAPIYLSDAPEDFVAKYITPLCYEDGKLLRPLAPAVPLPESIFLDPLNDPVPFRVMAPLSGRAMAVVIYSLSHPAPLTPIIAEVSVDDYRFGGGMQLPYEGNWTVPDEGLVVYDWYAQRGEKLESKYQVEISGFADRLLHLCPINKGWAVIGRADKYLSPAAVSVAESSDNHITVTMAEAGPLVIWSQSGKPSSEGIQLESLGKGFWKASIPTGQRNYNLKITR